MPSNPVLAGTATLADLRGAIAKIASGKSLSQDEAAEAFELVMSGCGDSGADRRPPDGAARARRDRRTRSPARPAPCAPRCCTCSAPEGAIDTCGTGGDGKGTFNISTCAAFVVAGAGVPVAKHGNRAISSRSGSADVLTALGVNIEASPETISRCIAECGLGFMFAPAHHAAMRHVAAVRTELGTRTIFNLLGPLANPAGTKFQIIGVFGKEWVEPIAQVLALLGTERAWVVHGSDGLDELTTTGVSDVAVVDAGKVSTFRISPRNAGLAGCAARGSHRRRVPWRTPPISAPCLAARRGRIRDIVLLNAAAALLVAGKAKSLRDGVALAAGSIDSGKALAVLEALVPLSHGKV